MKPCVVGIRRPGNSKSSPGKDAPTVWFFSVVAIAALVPATMERVFAGSK